MRTFNFKARNIGHEKYLTYTMGADCELDEDVLDYCEENQLKELVGIIYEEDEEYDYLTYDITEKVSLEDYIRKEVSGEKVLCILRNLAGSLISLKEQAIHLSYILLNKNFIYINEEDCTVSFICLPIESKGSVATEFKGFVRQLLANMKYDVEEDLNYVGKLLTYINGDNFNLRGLIGLSEALMEEAGIVYEEIGAIEADGIEVVNSESEIDIADAEKEEKVADFMNSLSDGDEPLPEIGDDEEEYEHEHEEETLDDEELESILPAGMKDTNAYEDETISEAVQAEADSDVTSVETVATPETDNVKKVSELLPDAKDVLDMVDETKEAEPVKKELAKEELKTETGSAEKAVDNADTKKSEKPSDKGAQKTSDIDLIKNRIKEIVGEVPSAKTTEQAGKSINTLQELDELLDSRPPVVKKNVVKVNRAALIQNIAAEHEAEMEAETVKNTEDGHTENIKVPVIEDVYEATSADKNDKEEKPKSNSVLSMTVADTPKTNNLINAPKAVPYLIRVNTEERIMLGKVTFKIGKASRGVDYTVSGNGAISRQHAVISQRDGVCYIKDNKSTNHTYVNGRMVEDGVEEILTHDSMIKLGDEEFLFKIR